MGPVGGGRGLAQPLIAHGTVTLHLVVDREQNQQSGSYQQCKQNTDYNRNNPMSMSGFNPFRSCDYLRRADPDPEGKFTCHGRYLAAGLWLLELRTGQSS